MLNHHVHPYGYGSIPINTIFRGMNIHLPAILMFTRGTSFDTLPYVPYSLEGTEGTTSGLPIPGPTASPCAARKRAATARRAAAGAAALLQWGATPLAPGGGEIAGEMNWKCWKAIGTGETWKPLDSWDL